MKKKKTRKTAAAIIASAFLSSCSFVSQDNVPVDVYGPPPENGEKETDTYEVENNVEPPVYGPPTVETTLPVEENVPEDVYGPPPEDGEPDN